MNALITSLLLIFMIVIKTQSKLLETSEETETIGKGDLNLLETLEQKHLEHEEAYEQFKTFVSPPSSLGRVNHKMTTLLQVLSIKRITNNFVNIIRILEGNILSIDNMLLLTRDLVRGIVCAIIEGRANLATEIGNPLYLNPENFHLVDDLVNSAYCTLFKLEGEAFEVYGTDLEEVINLFELSQEKREALHHNMGLLQEGLFISYNRVKALELRLYREVVFPQHCK